GVAASFSRKSGSKVACSAGVVTYGKHRRQFSQVFVTAPAVSANERKGDVAPSPSWTKQARVQCGDSYASIAAQHIDQTRKVFIERLALSLRSLIVARGNACGDEMKTPLRLSAPMLRRLDPIVAGFHSAFACTGARRPIGCVGLGGQLIDLRGDTRC